MRRVPKIDFSGVSGNVTFLQEALARPDGLDKGTWTSVLWAQREACDAVEVVAHFSLNDYRFSLDAHKDQSIRDILAAELRNGWGHFMVFVEWDDDRPQLSERIPIHGRIVETVGEGERGNVH